MSPTEAAEKECCTGSNGACTIKGMDGFTHSPTRHPGLGYDDDPTKGPITYCVVYDDGTEPDEAVADFDRVMVLCREAAERGVPSAAYADATMVYRQSARTRIGTML